MKRLYGCFMLFLLSTSVFAQNIQAVIQMDSIDVQKSTEEYGDEIYLVITEFDADGANTQFTIPQYPVTWPSEGIHQVKNVKLWQGEIKSGKTDEIIIELVEHDAPPYNVDDSIGSVRIKLNNNNGTLNILWQQNWDESAGKTNAAEVVKSDALTSKTFVFKGDGGEYTLTFSLKGNEVVNTNKQ